jgi:hypothetical protein
VCKEAAVAYFKALPLQLPGGTEEKQEKPDGGLLVSQSIS